MENHHIVLRLVRGKRTIEHKVFLKPEAPFASGLFWNIAEDAAFAADLFNLASQERGE